VIIPARNEQETVGDVVHGIRTSLRVNRIIVIDNGSEDATGEFARKAGGEVHECHDVGLGHAMLRGLSLSQADRVLRIDADISIVDFGRLAALVESEAALARGIFYSPYDSFPVTRLVVEPLLRLLDPGLTLPPLPLSGTYALSRSAFDRKMCQSDWSFDIALLLYALKSGMRVENVNIGILRDRPRTIDHYVPMATDIMQFLLSQASW